ncbi:MAG: IlvD/Edd family dehydratase [Betaproteobacteria bacterium]|jgi:dihydroxy-acid dehydratase
MTSKIKTKGITQGLTSYGDTAFSLFLRKAFIKAMGYGDKALDRPIIGITNTFSDFNPCHGNVPQIIRAVERGVMQSGGMPMTFPTISIHESFSYPTSMYLRNLMALDTEEMMRAQPVDAVVLIGGCDKTIPAQLMAAAAQDIPVIVIPTGPMLTGEHKGERLGACTDCRRFWGKFRAGEIDQYEIDSVNEKLAPTTGTCMVMGTASTIACMVEAMGMSLPGAAAIPAVYAERLRHSEDVGRRIVELAKEPISPKEIMTPEAITNALIVLHAIGGSTNALIHFTAIAAKLGIKLDLKKFDELGRKIPVLVDLKPSGSFYMEHLYEDGGLMSVLKELKPWLHLDCMTVSGKTLGDEIDAHQFDGISKVIRTASDPVYPVGGLAYLSGNIAPRGAVIKHASAMPKLLKHRGRAVVFSSLEDLTLRIDSPDLDVTADDVLVLQNAGPKGSPGMPEAGYLPIPKKLAQAGVKDMVRISDARMSGTAFGTIVLHITPEAADGGPLAIVRNGDYIELDVDARSIHLDVSDEEIKLRLTQLGATPPSAKSGYRKLYLSTVTQADLGCDFDFMLPEITRETPVLKTK